MKEPLVALDWVFFRSLVINRSWVRWCYVDVVRHRSRLSILGTFNGEKVHRRSEICAPFCFTRSVLSQIADNKFLEVFSFISFLISKRWATSSQEFYQKWRSSVRSFIRKVAWLWQTFKSSLIMLLLHRLLLLIIDKYFYKRVDERFYICSSHPCNSFILSLPR